MFDKPPHKGLTTAAQGFLEFTGAVKGAAVWQGGCCVNGLTVFRAAVRPNGVKMTKGQSVGIDAVVTACTRGVGPVTFQLLANGGWGPLVVPLAASSSGGTMTVGGGGGG